MLVKPYLRTPKNLYRQNNILHRLKTGVHRKVKHERKIDVIFEKVLGNTPLASRKDFLLKVKHKFVFIAQKGILQSGMFFFALSNEYRINPDYGI